MPTFLGILAALLIIGWGIHWYFARSARQWPSMLTTSPRSIPSVGFNSPPLVPRDAAEHLLRRQRLQEEGEIILVDDEEKPTEKKRTGKRSEMLIDSVPQKAIKNSAPIPTVAEIKLQVASRSARDSQGRVMGFCARCREKREVTKPKLTRTRKGKSAIRGHCVECGAGMFIFTLE